MRGILVVILAACGGCEWPPHLGGPTFDARDYVSDETYRALLIEVDAVDGRAGPPDVYPRVMAGLDALRDAGALGKDVVEFREDDLARTPLGDKKHSLAELRDAHDAAKDGEGANGVAVIRLLWVDGGYDEDEGIARTLGLSYAGDRIAMFTDSIEKACRREGAELGDDLCLDTAATVILHELGHLFGLVNNGAPMLVDHQDEENGHHDTDQDCVMYFSAEHSELVDLMADRAVGGVEGAFSFCSHCLDDLRGLDED